MHISVNTFEGSSPHTRGALPSRELFSLAVRIIPAYAGSTSGVYAQHSSAEDHPRIRGEHCRPWFIDSRGWGSSPHTRGAPGRAASARLHRGIIPAYAGSTPSPCYCGAARPDHPRIRGEHNLGEECSREGTGSSPHTRGAPQARLRRRFRARIIPAYAGSTTASWIGDSSRTDHPRIRGEHETHRAGHPPSTGSSPHTRGAPESAWSFQQSRRIIPAYAGSTSGSGTSGAPGRDHPRIRGEHHQMTATILNGSGSSPHTRGAHHGVRTHDRVGGIIPAYAGSTTPGVSDRGYPGDHPRIRGEHRVASRRHVQMPGSSPHTRGAPFVIAASFLVLLDHPRIRGEHIPYFSIGSRSPGSSPHTRGAPRLAPARLRRRRIIPAYAGSTHVRASADRAPPDHPRIRGEHPPQSLDQDQSRRIIPAYAGSTRSRRSLTIS